jgi:gentisate 1,2-dioxygenase
MPKFLPHRRGKGFGAPMFVYRWQDTLQQLQSLRDLEGDPRDGIIVEYINPVNGRSVLPTLSFRAQLFGPGGQPQWQRRTASTLFCVVEGHGRTELEDTTLEWKRNDIFCVPSWQWYRNVNLSPDSDLILYSVSDSPALEKLGFYRSQGRDECGRTFDIASSAQDIAG